MWTLPGIAGALTLSKRGKCLTCIHCIFAGLSILSLTDVGVLCLLRKLSGMLRIPSAIILGIARGFL